MADRVALSEAAVAILRFRIKGYQTPVTERRLEAFRELVDAGLMELDAVGDYRFTEADPERRQGWLDAAEVRLRSLAPRLPDRIELSDAARDVLSHHVEGDQKATDANRPAYR
jgi:hypothetical protein